MNKRLQAIFDEIEELSKHDEDPNDWVGFVHPETFTEFRHPSSQAKIDGSVLYVSGLEVRPNELVDKGAMILISRELVHDGEGSA